MFRKLIGSSGAKGGQVLTKLRTLAATATLLALAVLGLHSSPSQAMIIWDWDATTQTLSGARNVPIGGGLYNVEFIDGSCIGLFNGCNELSDFQFQSESAARSAAQALDQYVFTDTNPHSALFDSAPSLTRGCTQTVSTNVYAGDQIYCEIWIPYGFDFGSSTSPPFDIFGASFWNSNNNSWDVERWNITANAPVDFSIAESSTYAVFTAVPEPSTLVIFAFGLAGLGVVQRRRKAA